MELLASKSRTQICTYNKDNRPEEALEHFGQGEIINVNHLKPPLYAVVGTLRSLARVGCEVVRKVGNVS